MKSLGEIALELSHQWRFCNPHWIEIAIKLIGDAQRDALEEAAKYIETNAFYPHNGIHFSANDCAAHVRALAEGLK